MRIPLKSISIIFAINKHHKQVDGVAIGSTFNPVKLLVPHLIHR